MKKEDIDAILASPEVTHCYIQKKGWYYLPTCSGYTEIRAEAGIFPKETAASHARHSDTLYLESIDNEEHNKMLRAKIADMTTRIIN